MDILAKRLQAKLKHSSCLLVHYTATLAALLPEMVIDKNAGKVNALHALITILVSTFLHNDHCRCPKTDSNNDMD